MALTTDSVTAAVNAELQNVAYGGACTATGDGSTLAYCIAPLGFYVEAGSVTCTVAGSAVTAFTMDYENGVCTFDAAPADAAEVAWRFNYSTWSATQTDQAVDAAIENIFPAFYKEDTENVTSTGLATEYALTAGEFVTGVYSTSDSVKFTRITRGHYETYNHGATKYLRFYSAPSSGTLRVHTVQRCAIGDLPDRAISPLISYACYYLITQKLAPRVRQDVAIATQGQGTIYPSQIKLAAEAFYMRYQFQCASMKQPPWWSR